jgi:hypothetical protein
MCWNASQGRWRDRVRSRNGGSVGAGRRASTVCRNCRIRSIQYLPHSTMAAVNRKTRIISSTPTAAMVTNRQRNQYTHFIRVADTYAGLDHSYRPSVANGEGFDACTRALRAQQTNFDLPLLVLGSRRRPSGHPQTSNRRPAESALDQQAGTDTELHRSCANYLHSYE